MKNPSPTTLGAEPLPLVALIGPTNAGKSTLFNRLTSSRQMITAKEPSTTRDRVYGEVVWQGRRFLLVDSAGLTNQPTELDRITQRQVEIAITEADLLLLVFDGQKGLDQPTIQLINSWRARKKLWLIANKIDSANLPANQWDYLKLPYYPISALTGRGVGDLLDQLVNQLPAVTQSTSQSLPIVAIIGRPNVGKSSLLNALTKQERAVVSPQAGTTRDLVTARLAVSNTQLLLVDTAGVRRRGKIKPGIEKFSVKRALTLINHAEAVLVVVDASEGTTRGDLHLIYYAHSLNKPILIVFNKADLVSQQPAAYHRHLARFTMITASALTGYNLDKIVDWLEAVLRVSSQEKQLP